MYGRTRSGRVYLLQSVQRYRWEVLRAWMAASGEREPLDGPLRIEVAIYLKNKRNRDTDNFPKVLGDAMQDAGVFENDSQINDWFLHRAGIDPAGMGKLVVTITEIC